MKLPYEYSQVAIQWLAEMVTSEHFSLPYSIPIGEGTHPTPFVVIPLSIAIF